MCLQEILLYWNSIATSQVTLLPEILKLFSIYIAMTLTSLSVGQRRVASSYFLHASSSKASLDGELDSGLTLSALSCMHSENSMKPNNLHQDVTSRP